MSIDGAYELALTCDHVTPLIMVVPLPGPPNICGRKQTFFDTSRMQAIDTARRAGWLISKDRRAFCPPHAAERRQNRHRDASS